MTSPVFTRSPGALRPFDGASEIAVLRELVAYDPGTGLLTWKPRDAAWFPPGNTGREGVAASWNKRYAGKKACSNAAVGGYLAGPLLGAHLKSHRVAWAITYRCWPAQIDHINGDPSDNRRCNLRAATYQQNLRNRALPSCNTSGRIGVHFRPERNRWMAHIGVNNTSVSLGSFATFEQAVAAREAAEKLHGYHPNHGRRSREREPVLALARAMRTAFNLAPAAALAPMLVLTSADRI